MDMILLARISRPVDQSNRLPRALYFLGHVSHKVDLSNNGNVTSLSGRYFVSLLKFGQMEFLSWAVTNVSNTE